MTANNALPTFAGPPHVAAPWTGTDTTSGPTGGAGDPDGPGGPSGPGRADGGPGGSGPTGVLPRTGGSGSGGGQAEVPSVPIGRGIVAASVVLLLAGTAVLYFYGLSGSGWANSFYSAAAQAGGTDWKAWFYGSLDAANAITVDKPPAALWLMGLSVRLFGLSSWSILAPEALLGVASVGLIYATLRRVLTRGEGGARIPLTLRAHVASLVGAAVFALTPVAVLMFRFNNPDALLTFCMILATYFTLRAAERARARWLVAAGVVIGLGFLTKMLQAFLVLPALVAAYLVAAPTGWGRRIRHLLYAFAAMVVSFGWYVAVVELTPASLRPYIGGSQNNSILELAFGYNGFGRITGNETGSVTGGGGGFGGGGAGGGMWGETGLLRMFSGVSGGMVSWLIPAALVLGVAALVFLHGRKRTDLLRAAIIAFGGWLVTMMVVFSFMAGIYHDYYTVVLAPAIGALLALGGYVVWGRRNSLAGRIVLAGTMALTTVWAIVLLSEASGLYLTLRWVVLLLGTLATVALLAVRVVGRALRSTVVGVALAAALVGPAAYALDTAATPHTGSIVTAGPVSNGGPGGAGRTGRAAGFNRTRGTTAGGTSQGGPGQGAQGMPPGGFGQTGTGTQNGTGTGTQNGTGSTGQLPAFGAGPMGQTGGLGEVGAGRAGGAGGLLEGAQVSSEMTTLLTADASRYTWVAASIGSQNAASYQLATQLPVMAIGGFNGSDPSPTLAQFQEYVAQGRIHYFIAGGMGGQQNGGSSAASEISSWVTSHYTAQTVGTATVYDLTAPTS
ncbi:ArnT family glycosyltransferase [Raineyella sp. W15-4]|uniref:ArnT family glycosyltransferase n=1 Tax=Raineyella sp. W15-4 TaxID=3081651 RepID=UPI002953316B|nr:glycosyltransferase family 39 protein [Raineyella sp. W15-4]WOQ16568.1 glycosyltransferase family 39 protein [Raineyella sp. W15-4]